MCKYTVISGSGCVTSKYNKIDISKEETIYIPQGVEYLIQGDLELIKSYV